MKNGSVPVKYLSVLAMHFESLSAAAAEIRARAVGNFPMEGEVSALEGPDRSSK